MRNRRLPEEIDSVDRKILSILRSNARKTSTSIAIELGLSRTAVQERIRRLEIDGIIAGYTIITKSCSDDVVAAVLSITIATRPCAPTLARLSSVSEMRALYSISGPIDAIMIVEIADIEQLSAIVDAVSATEGVAKVVSSVVLTKLLAHQTL